MPTKLTPEQLAEIRSWATSLPLNLSGADAIAWHFEQGEPNAGLSEEALAAALRSLVRLKDIPAALDLLLKHCTALEEDLNAVNQSESKLKFNNDQLREQVAALEEELKAAQGSLALVGQVQLVGQEALDKSLGELRTGFVNDFRAQLVEAVRARLEESANGIEAKAVHSVLQLIQTFEAGEVSE